MRRKAEYQRVMWKLNIWGTILFFGLGILASPSRAAEVNKAWESANIAGMQAYRQKRYADAKQWFMEALSEAQRTQEPSPPKAMTLNNLAAVHEALGEVQEAELRYQQSLSVVESIQGPNHPDVIPGLNNLAALYAKQGQFRRAEPLWRRSLTILESALGPKHPHLIPSIMLIAQATQVQGRFEESEKMYTKALSIADTELEPNHHHTATILRRYAILLHQVNREDEATQFEERAKAIEENLNPPQ